MRAQRFEAVKAAVLAVVFLAALGTAPAMAAAASDEPARAQAQPTGDTVGFMPPQQPSDTDASDADGDDDDGSDNKPFALWLFAFASLIPPTAGLGMLMRRVLHQPGSEPLPSRR